MLSAPSAAIWADDTGRPLRRDRSRCPGRGYDARDQIWPPVDDLQPDASNDPLDYELIRACGVQDRVRGELRRSQGRVLSKAVASPFGQRVQDRSTHHRATRRRAVQLTVVRVDEAQPFAVDVLVGHFRCTARGRIRNDTHFFQLVTSQSTIDHQDAPVSGT